MNKMPKIKIAPSILSADFKRINEEIGTIEKGSDLLHVDIMDGIFVPPTTIDAAFVRTFKTKVLLDVHLMVHEPSDEYLLGFIKAGAHSITVHVEACRNPAHQIKFIKSHKVKACISLKPNTSIEAILPYIDLVDMVLVMTVEPGWGGQKFIGEMMPKVRQLRTMRPALDIEVDGGINPLTAGISFENGANVFVAGNFVFKHENRLKAIDEIRSVLK
jgi:ribulose-phosphate 3-epimerase